MTFWWHFVTNSDLSRTHSINYTCHQLAIVVTVQITLIWALQWQHNPAAGRITGGPLCYLIRAVVRIADAPIVIGVPIEVRQARSGDTGAQCGR